MVGANLAFGGWEYVGAAYGIVWTTLALYGFSLWRRGRRAPQAVVEKVQ